MNSYFRPPNARNVHKSSKKQVLKSTEKLSETHNNKITKWQKYFSKMTFHIRLFIIKLKLTIENSTYKSNVYNVRINLDSKTRLFS